jgi:PncC family amidohydrolase
VARRYGPESSTGGLIAAALLSIPGASKYFMGGGVIYTQGARRALLTLPDEAVKGIRSSTEAAALVNARTVRERLGTTWAIGETGAAGPTGNRYGDAAGHTCVAVVGPVERARTIETRRSDREANMWAFTRAPELLEGAYGRRGEGSAGCFQQPRPRPRFFHRSKSALEPRHPARPRSRSRTCRACAILGGVTDPNPPAA